jgi:hypothetical protein
MCFCGFAEALRPQKIIGFANPRITKIYCPQTTNPQIMTRISKKISVCKFVDL